MFHKEFKYKFIRWKKQLTENDDVQYVCVFITCEQEFWQFIIEFVCVREWK